MSAARQFLDKEVHVTPIASRPIPAPKFLGDALEMERMEWLELNSIHVRERWRNLLDSCLVLDLEAPDESEYGEYALTVYETELARRRYERGL